MQSSIALQAIETKKLFNEIIQDRNLPFECTSRVEDQFTRYKIWIGTTNVFDQQPSIPSLDSLVRCLPATSSQIGDLLLELSASLRKVKVVDSEKWEKLATNNGDSDVEEPLECIKKTITCLTHIADLVVISGEENRFARALVTIQPFDATADKRHVFDKFPLLNDETRKWLGERLGTGMSRGRQYLSYARSHPAKLSEVSEEPQRQVGPSRACKMKADTQMFAPASGSADMGSKPDFSDKPPSPSSAISILGDTVKSDLTPPSLLTVSNGETEFICPLCGTIQNFDSEILWRKHMYADLRSYVCTFRDCPTPHFCYREDWFKHEQEQHRARWQCRLCNTKDLSSENEFQQHLDSHGTKKPNFSMDVLSEAWRYSPDKFQASDCPLCRDWDDQLRRDTGSPTSPSVTPAEFKKHVGSHMEQLALFVLPAEYTGRVEVTATGLSSPQRPSRIPQINGDNGGAHDNQSKTSGRQDSTMPESDRLTLRTRSTDVSPTISTEKSKTSVAYPEPQSPEGGRSIRLRLRRLVEKVRNEFRK